MEMLMKTPNTIVEMDLGTTNSYEGYLYKFTQLKEQ